MVRALHLELRTPAGGTGPGGAFQSFGLGLDPSDEDHPTRQMGNTENSKHEILAKDT